MADSTGDYRILINRLRKSLQVFDVPAAGDESAPLPDQAYRLLVLLAAAALRRRIDIADDTTLNTATRARIVSAAIGTVSPGNDSHLDAAAYQIADATALLNADAARAGEDSPQGVIFALLSAASFLITALMLDESSHHGSTLVDGDDTAIPIPRAATLVGFARDRVTSALDRLDGLFRDQ
jgi:hypothetical protein